MSFWYIQHSARPQLITSLDGPLFSTPLSGGMSVHILLCGVYLRVVQGFQADSIYPGRGGGGSETAGAQLAWAD